MASRSPPPPKPPAPRCRTIIVSLGEELLLEVFLRLPSLPSLIRAALACRAFAAAVRSFPLFRRRFVALRPPPLLSLFLIFPTPPDEFSSGCRGKCVYMDPFLLCSEEVPGSFRVVTICHGKSRLRAAVFSSGTREWQILLWSKPAPGQPSGRKYWLLRGRQANGKLYWSHTKQAYKEVLDTVMLQFSFIDLPEQLKGKDHLYMAGEAKDGRPCIVSAADFALSIWLQRADTNGVEKWMLDSVIPLEEEVLQATKGSLDDHGDLKVLAILDGNVYLSTFETFIDASVPVLLSGNKEVGKDLP